MTMIALVTLWMMLVAFPADAAHTHYGYGSKTCAEYVSVQEDLRSGKEGSAGENLVFMNWFYGFASGVSALKGGRDVLKDLDDDSVRRWLEDYCREHPRDSFLLGGLSLINSLQAE